ncbi:hypothetical protein BT63DRAFT_457993 [Microthyrium microscopicum]|uniref:Uncharacterized protein n=1 Tax=Microthyrium microscopicum TaxID=703497 RepID=A0A6A6U7U9_9PEZI|nr:hypothetical protein BT63DRAFT_457993 [Microthyrium microscopicum]
MSDRLHTASASTITTSSIPIPNTQPNNQPNLQSKRQANNEILQTTRDLFDTDTPETVLAKIHTYNIDMIASRMAIDHPSTTPTNVDLPMVYMCCGCLRVCFVPLQVKGSPCKCSSSYCRHVPADNGCCGASVEWLLDFNIKVWLRYVEILEEKNGKVAESAG